MSVVVDNFTKGLAAGTQARMAKEVISDRRAVKKANKALASGEAGAMERAQQILAEAGMVNPLEPNFGFGQGAYSSGSGGAYGIPEGGSGSGGLSFGSNYGSPSEGQGGTREMFSGGLTFGLPAYDGPGTEAHDPGQQLAFGIMETANALQMDPLDLATIFSYETGGTFDPTKRGPRTQWGQHRGLLQFGEPQARQYGADFSDPWRAMATQLGKDGAIARYYKDNGWRPGMGLMDAYSIVNAGAPGRYNASDAGNGGAWGTVADKVNYQMAPHRQRAMALLAPYMRQRQAIPV